MLLSTRLLKYLDPLGAMLSFACALHCALQPVLLLSLPLLGLSFLLNETLETLFLAISLILAAWAFLSGYTHHHRLSVFGFWILASLLMVCSRLPWFALWEIPLAVGGALVLMSGHLFNQFQLRHGHSVSTVCRSTGMLPFNTSIPPASCNHHH